MDLSTLDAIGGLPLVYLPEVDSTNRVARELARQGWAGVVVADHQHAGRGRMGRSWDSEPGQNLLMSVVLSPPVPAKDAARCVLLWAAAIADALDIWVKWPNDLVDPRDQKLGGMLAELELDGERVRHIVLGIGLNVNQTTFPGLPGAGSLRLLRGGAQDRAQILGAVVAALLGADTRGSLGLWRRRSRTLGRRVEVAGVVGVAEDVREDGALLVDGSAVLAGDVSLI